jgi:hypothetical protein
MHTDDEEPSPIGEFLGELTGFLDETVEAGPEGWAMVERMRVAMPVEFYVRADPAGTGRVAAVEGRPASRTLTSFMPVLHGLSVVVEVDGAGQQREPGMEP